MKIFTALAAALWIAASSLVCAQTIAYVGVHQAYTRLRFNNPHRLEGWLTGVKVGVQQEGCWLYSEAFFEGYWDIADFAGNPCQRSSVEEYFVEGNVGVSFSLCRLCARPLVGFGYDFFRNEQDPSHSALTYRYRKLYVPVGIWVEACLYERFSAGLLFRWRPDVYARLRVAHLTFPVERESAYRVEVPLSARINWCLPGCLKVVVTPYFDWNRFGKIEKRTSLGVPFSSSKLTRAEWGARASLAVCF